MGSGQTDTKKKKTGRILHKSLSWGILIATGRMRGQERINRCFTKWGREGKYSTNTTFQLHFAVSFPLAAICLHLIPCSLARGSYTDITVP